jgi:hypothetical protein
MSSDKPQRTACPETSRIGVLSGAPTSLRQSILVCARRYPRRPDLVGAPRADANGRATPLVPTQEVGARAGWPHAPEADPPVSVTA